MRRFTLYTRPGCHLCEELVALLERLAPEVPVERVDISGSRELEERYGEWIPVLVVDGKERLRGIVSEALVRRLL